MSTVKSKIKEKIELKNKINEIEDEISDDVREKFEDYGIKVENVIIESSLIEFEVQLSSMIDRDYLHNIENEIEYFEFTSIMPKNESGKPVLSIFFELEDK